MAEVSKPDYRYVWSSGGANVSPSNTKIQTGWVSEVPPYQWENYLQNRQDNMLVHINQHGIPCWDALTEYFGTASYVTGSDGQVYRSVQNSGPNTTTQDPTTDASDTYWRLAFADASGNYITQTTGDARYLKKLNNLSDLSNIATARTNLGVFFDSVRVDVASSATVNLTTSAATTSHINITGAVGISNFTVVAGKCYFARFAGVLTLTNSASLVTNSGADIVTAQGDSCIIRAIASNIVEILCYTRGAYNTWQAPARALNTDYTNTGGRVRIAQVATNIAVGAITNGLVAGSTQSTFSNNGSGGAVYTHLLIIPPGDTYRVNSGTLQSWRELVL